MQHFLLEGRIIKSDPEMKTTANNKKLVNFTVCETQGYGEYKTNTFFDCIAWNKTAEIINQYFKKGSVILAEIIYKPNTYTNKSGNNVLRPQFVVEKLHFPLRDKSENATSDTENTGNTGDFSTASDNNSDIGNLDEFEELNTNGDDLPF